MKRRVAFPLNAADEAADPIRAPRAFSSTETVDAPDLVETWTDAAADPGNVPVPALRRSWLARILWGTASLLVSLGLGLALDALIRNLFATNPWLGWVVLFVVADLLFYGLHWLMHKTRYGWCSHITHHSSTRYNLSTALRQNVLFDLSGLALLWWLPLALIGFDKFSVVLTIELNLFFQFFIHTEVIKRMPAWYEAIFNTPSHHRVHHGRNPGQLDTNFGGVFIIWDRLFGTFVDERDAGTIAYGISHRQPTTLNPLRLNLDEWFAMWCDAWRYKDLRILWKHPDWVEETDRHA